MIKKRKNYLEAMLALVLIITMVVTSIFSEAGLNTVSAASKKKIKYYDGEVSYSGNSLGTGELFSCKDDKYLYVVGSSIGFVAYNLETNEVDKKFKGLPAGQFIQQDDKYVYYITRLKENSKRTQSIIRVSKSTGKKKVLLKKSKSKSKFGGFGGLTLMNGKLFYQYYHDAKTVSQNYTYVTKYSVDTYSMKINGKSNKKEKKVKLKAYKDSYPLKSEYAELSGSGHLTGKKGIVYSEKYKRMYYPDSKLKITIKKLADPKKEETTTETTTEDKKPEETTSKTTTEDTKTDEVKSASSSLDMITGAAYAVGAKHSVKVKAYSIRYMVVDDYVVCFAEHWKKTGKKTFDVYIMQCDASKMKKICSGDIK